MKGTGFPARRFGVRSLLILELTIALTVLPLSAVTGSVVSVDEQRVRGLTHRSDDADGWDSRVGNVPDINGDGWDDVLVQDYRTDYDSDIDYESESVRISVVDGRTGRRLWTFKRGPVQSQGWLTGYMKPARVGPQAKNGFVYFQYTSGANSDSLKVRGLSGRGTILWERDLSIAALETPAGGQVRMYLQDELTADILSGRATDVLVVMKTGTDDDSTASRFSVIDGKDGSLARHHEGTTRGSLEMVADFSRDGLMDYLLKQPRSQHVQEGDRYKVLRGYDGAELWTSEVLPPGWFDWTVGDVVGNGSPELLHRLHNEGDDEQGTIMLDGATGRTFWAQSSSASVYPLGDVDRDGKAEMGLATVRNRGSKKIVRFMARKGNGQLAYAREKTLARNGANVFIHSEADLDGDGVREISLSRNRCSKSLRAGCTDSISFLNGRHTRTVVRKVLRNDGRTFDELLTLASLDRRGDELAFLRPRNDGLDLNVTSGSMGEDIWSTKLRWQGAIKPRHTVYWDLVSVLDTPRRCSNLLVPLDTTHGIHIFAFDGLSGRNLWQWTASPPARKDAPRARTKSRTPHRCTGR